MGCHTWFYRPVTDKEMELIKEYAPKEIYYLCGDSKENIKDGLYDKALYESLMKSYNENIPCVYGLYYWELGYGTGNPKLKDHMCKSIDGKLYFDVSEYNDIFRVKNYPIKDIHSRYQLRKFLREKYFLLTGEQLKTVSEFFKENPGGVIIFG